MRFSEYLDRATGLYPNHEAFVDHDIRMDFQTACDHTHQIANALTFKLSLAPGTKVAIYSPNNVLGYLAVLGVNRADMIWLPVNYRNALDSNIDLLEFFGAECLLFHSQFDDEVLRIREQIPSIQTTVCIDSDSAHGVSMKELLEDCSTDFLRTAEDPNAPTILIGTGGTTGPSKGVMLSQRNIETSLFLQMDLDITEHPRYLVVAAITHAAGLFIPVFYALGGATVILPSFDAESLLKTVEQERITHLYLPPTAIYALLDFPDLDKYDTSSLQGFYCGAAPIAPARFKEAVQVFGPCMTELYGQSETFFPTIVKTSADYLDAQGNFRETVLASAGRASKKCWIEIMDDDGNILGPGEKGEIVVRGSSVMLGYYNNPEATAEVSSHGWHHTTDMGIRDEDGYITIVDRKKDMIITGGFNVYPVEIEKLLNSHPAVRDAAVIGVPDEKWGEAVKAVIQLNDGEEVDAEVLMSLCKEKLGSVKTPKTVEFWDELPLSPVGKVLKREIRDKFWRGHTRAV